MIKYSITNLLLKDLKVKKNKKKVIGICFEYLLGLELYKNTNNKLKKYKKSKLFSKFIKELDSSYSKYIINNLRRYAKHSEKVKIKKLDKKVINYLDNKLDYSKIVIPKKIISENRIIDTFEKSINKSSFDVYLKIKNDNSTDLQDLRSELSIKVIQNFRLYKYCYMVKGFNKKVFLKCLHNGINAKKVDILRYYFRSKRDISKKTSIKEEY